MPELPNSSSLTISDFPASPDDAELVRACINGDERAWEILIERYSRLIYTIPLRFGFSKVIADEIFQETCLVLLEKLDTLQNHHRLRAWLVTVTRRACIQRWRQSPHTQELDVLQVDTADEGNIDAQLLRLEQHHLVGQAFDNLNSRCRQLLMALFFEEPARSYRDISKTFDIPSGSIGPVRKRCLETLRQEIEKLE